MPQPTLDRYLKRSAPFAQDSGETQEPKEQQQQQQSSHTRSTSTRPCRRGGLLNMLQAQAYGLQPAARTRKALAQHGNAGHQQLASFEVSSLLIDSSPITSIAIKPGRLTTFVQANGIMTMTTADILQQEARKISSRSAGFVGQNNEENEDERQLDPYLYTSECGQPSPEDEDASSSSQSRSTSQHPNLAGHSAGAWLNYGLKVRSHRRACTHRAWAASQERRDALPLRACGTCPACPRFQMGQSLDDVAWDPHANYSAAMVGSTSHSVTVVNVEEGRRTRTKLNPKQVNSGTTGPGLTSVKYFNQGPYTLAAAGRNTPKVLLWDQRRSSVAVAELSTPGRVPLQAPIELAPDGTVLYGVTTDNQLLMWDIRKGSQGSGVLNFGGSGPYHHDLLGSFDLGKLLADAQAQHLCGEQPFSEASLISVRPPAPVDQVLVNPCSPSRLGLVLQNCGSAVLDVCSGRITHSCLPPNLYYSMGLTAPNRYSLQHKRGTWDPSGLSLWVPHAWMHTSPTTPLDHLHTALGLSSPSPPNPTNLHPTYPTTTHPNPQQNPSSQPSQQPQQRASPLEPQLPFFDVYPDLPGCKPLQQALRHVAANTRPAHSTHSAAQRGPLWEALLALCGTDLSSVHMQHTVQVAQWMSARPAVAALDCRDGGSSITSSTTRSSSSSSSSGRSSSMSKPQGVGKSARLGEDGGQPEQPSATTQLLRRPFSVHQLGSPEPPELTAVQQLLSRSYAKFTSVPEDLQATVDTAALRAAATCVREAVFRPRALVPVADWVTCMACDPESGLLLAGGHSGALMVIGPGGYGRCCFAA